MKNRVLGTLVALAMVLALAGPAAAAWENEMVGVVYNPSGIVEYGFSLGEITSDIAPDGPLWKTIGSAGTVTKEPFGPAAVWSDIYFGLFSDHRLKDAVNNVGYYVTSKNTQGSVGGAVALGFTDGAKKLTDIWAAGDTTNPTATMSFTGASMRQGEYAGVNVGDSGLGVANLGGFADPGTDVIAEMYLYKVVLKSTRPSDIAAAPFSDDFDYHAKLRVLSDGSIQVSAVPVPGAIVLLGSGLLALVGIRRKVS